MKKNAASDDRRSKKKEKEIIAQKLFSLALKNYMWEKLSPSKLVAIIKFLDLLKDT